MPSAKKDVHTALLIEKIRVLSHKGVMEAIMSLADTAKRYSQLGNDVESKGVSRSAFAQTINELLELGLIERKIDSSWSPPHVIYSLSERGWEVHKLLQKLMEVLNKS